jgi:aminopeptidase N
MKKLATLITASCFALILSGQIQSPSLAIDQAQYSEILSELQNNQHLEALVDLNKFIRGYSSSGVVYFLRGMARTGLNDVIGARKDFLLAKGAGYTNNEDYIEAMTSKETLVKEFLKILKDDSELDAKRDYRPVILPRDTIQGALRPERNCFDVHYYNLTIKIIPETSSIEGSNRICFTTLADTRTIQIDLFPELTVTSITRKESPLKYNRLERAIFIDLGEVLPAGSKEDIVVEYKGTPLVAKKPPWNGGFVWEKDKNRLYTGVACEHLGASSWWPVKDHLSDKPDSMTINIQVPDGYQGVSNGNLRSQSKMPGGYTNFEWHVSYPINTYNVTYYMGDFVNFNEEYVNGESTFRMDYYVLPRNIEKAKKYYSQTKEIVKVFEKCFGDYPFKNDGIGMVEAPFEGMEHQGAIAIGGGYGKSNNRREYWTKEYDYLLIHETAHEWWGNAVAIGDMADAWINEGFGTYSECLFAEEKFGYQDYLKAIAAQQSLIFNIWPIVGERNINSNTFLGGDIYNKGSAMLNNLRCIINNDTLFKGMIKSFFQKNKYRIVTTNDFISHVKDYTKTDFTDFFNVFLFSTEPPILACNYNIDKDKILYFNYKWTNVGRNFTMPFCIAVNDKEYLRLNGTTNQQTFRFENAKTFYLPNQNRFDEQSVPQNSFTYYWTSWPF